MTTTQNGAFTPQDFMAAVIPSMMAIMAITIISSFVIKLTTDKSPGDIVNMAQRKLSRYKV